MRLLCRNTGTYAEACDLGHVSKPFNKHDHIHKEYKYRNGALRWVSKPDGFGKPQELGPHDAHSAGASAHVASDKRRPKEAAPARRKRQAAHIRDLDWCAEQFAKTLKMKFRRWIKRSSRAFKKRILSRVASHLPPYPRSGGRRRFPHITKAVNLYRDQLRQVREKARAKVAWTTIARECIPGFDQMPYYARANRLGALRNAVYARRKRERKAKRQRRSARPTGPPFAG
jgi:hypothetical protein